MAIYEIELKYVATTTQTVQANDEGEALELARNKAEEAEFAEYTLVNELESRIVQTR